MLYYNVLTCLTKHKTIFNILLST